jgi:hypothetical protein
VALPWQACLATIREPRPQLSISGMACEALSATSSHALLSAACNAAMLGGFSCLGLSIGVSRLQVLKWRGYFVR